MVKNENYIQISGWMINEFPDLRLNEVFIYAVIHGFCQDGKSLFTGSLSYLEDWTNSSKPTVIAALQKLVEKKYIVKLEKYVNNKKYCAYYTVRSRIPNNGIETKQMVKNYARSEIFTEDSQNSLPSLSKNFTSNGQNSLPNNTNKILNRNSAEILSEETLQDQFIPKTVATADYILSKIKDLFGSNIFDSAFVPELSNLMKDAGLEGDRINEYLQSVYEITLSKKPVSIPNLFRIMAKAPDVIQNFLLQHPEKKTADVPMMQCPVCNSKTPRYEGACSCCGFEIGQSNKPEVVTREKQVFALPKQQQQELKQELEKAWDTENFLLNPAEIEKRKQRVSEVYKKFGINA